MAIFKRWFRDFPCSFSPYTCIASPIINISHQSGIFITTDECSLTHWNHPKSIVYIMVYSSCCTFYGFGQKYNDMYPSF